MQGCRVLTGLTAALLAALASAEAEIVVAPLRQVITAKSPIATYKISNPSDRIVEARIDWIDLTATEDGYVSATPAARAALSAAPYLVVAPARLRLEPGGRAEIVVRLKDGMAVPAGERRSHLLIETTPARTPLRRASTGLEVDVGLGVSTPVILRGGFAAPSTSFQNSRLSRDDIGRLVFKTTLASEGKYSAYGTITATFSAGGKTIEVARLNNVALYPESGARQVSIPLLRETLPPGRLRVAFTGAGEQAAQRYAAKDFEIAPPQ